jgi:hypothetical protein
LRKKEKQNPRKLNSWAFAFPNFHTFLQFSTFCFDGNWVVAFLCFV